MAKKDIDILPKVKEKSPNYYMRCALRHAKVAAARGEVPVGAVVVYNGRIIASGKNVRESSKSALAHAEIQAISRACKKMGGWRLHECDLYVTLEPCPMCAGAIINSRIRKVYIGTRDEKAGSFGSVANFNDLPYNHKCELIYGICEKDCKNVISNFFKKLRENKRK